MNNNAKEIVKNYKLQGYHCSESIIRTVNDVLDLKMSDDVLRCACGFRGGGGGYRDRCGIIRIVAANTPCFSYGDTAAS